MAVSVIEGTLEEAVLKRRRSAIAAPCESAHDTTTMPPAPW